jgi:hypothetical protein
MRSFAICNSTPNITRLIKSRKLREEEHVALIAERCIQGFGGETLRHKATWKN